MINKIIFLLSGFLSTEIVCAHGQHPHSDTFMQNLPQLFPGTGILLAILTAGLFALIVKKSFTQ